MKIKEPFYPSYHTKVYQTKKGTSYLKEAGVVLVAQSIPDYLGVRKFLQGFNKRLEFPDYLRDRVELDPAVSLSKFAGQTCYMSFGPKRTWNKDADRYLANIVSSGHGSVLEHANFTFLLYGVSRSLTHELVRHRAGMGYSQESQRYVGGPVLRFVERPEFQKDRLLHQQFEQRIDRVFAEYENYTSKLEELQKEGLDIVSGEKVTDQRKKVRQAARAVLTNETEAIIIATGNLRAWRHIITMRVSGHAEIEIRKAIFKVFLCLRKVSLLAFSDYKIVNLADGTKVVKTDYPKV